MENIDLGLIIAQWLFLFIHLSTIWVLATYQALQQIFWDIQVTHLGMIPRLHGACNRIGNWELSNTVNNILNGWEFLKLPRSRMWLWIMSQTISRPLWEDGANADSWRIHADYLGDRSLGNMPADDLAHPCIMVRAGRIHRTVQRDEMEKGSRARLQQAL